MMNHLLTLALLGFLAMPMQAQTPQISNVEQASSWIYIYDQNGKRIKTISRGTAGDLVAWGTSFLISKKGGWYYLFDVQGKHYKSLSISSVGEIISASGDTFTTKLGGWVHTYDRNGKRIRTRSANSY